MGRGNTDERSIELEEVTRSALEAPLPDLDAMDSRRGPKLLAEVATALEEQELRRGVEDLIETLQPLAASRTAMELLTDLEPGHDAKRVISAIGRASYFHPEDPSLQGLFRRNALVVALERSDTPLLVIEPRKMGSRTHRFCHARLAPDSERTLCNRQIADDWHLNAPRGELNNPSGVFSRASCLDCREAAAALPPGNEVTQAASESFQFEVVDHEQLREYQHALCRYTQNRLHDLYREQRLPAPELFSVLCDRSDFDAHHQVDLSDWFALAYEKTDKQRWIENLFHIPDAKVPDPLPDLQPLQPVLARMRTLVADYYPLDRPQSMPKRAELRRHFRRALKERSGGRLQLVADLMAKQWPIAASLFLAEVEAKGMAASASEVQLAKMIELSQQN